MKSLVIAGAVSLAALLSAPEPLTAGEALSVQLILDNGGGLLNPGEAEPVIDQMFNAVLQAARNPKFKYGNVNVITTSTADSTKVPRTVWSGRLVDIKRSYPDIIAAARHVPNGCTDLVRAFNEADFNIRKSSASEVWVIAFSSFIHMGRPCTDTGIDLPQEVPPQINLGGMVTDDRVKRIVLLNAEPDQARKWFEVMEAAGAAIRAREGSFQYAVETEDTTYRWLSGADLHKELR